MMLCLALRSDPELVYQRALRKFSVAEISEAFAAARGLALPSQLRRMLRDKGRDLHAEFLDLLPARPHPIRIQRWSARRERGRGHEPSPVDDDDVVDGRDYTDVAPLSGSYSADRAAGELSVRKRLIALHD
jgi:hypothetical protein